jgi:hypothetical protein
MYTVHLNCYHLRNKIDYMSPYRVYSKNIGNNYFEYAFETFYDRKQFITHLRKVYPCLHIKIIENPFKQNTDPFHSYLTSYV